MEGAVFSATRFTSVFLFFMAGKWSEGLYCGVAPSARCVWRPGALPEDHALYYGFSRFAIELNDLEAGLVDVLPPTDSRFRPDQRLLEEGNVPGAEAREPSVFY